jgi:hypothetical protein
MGDRFHGMARRAEGSGLNRGRRIAGDRRGQPTNSCFFYGVPTVRIHLPPPTSQLRTRLPQCCPLSGDRWFESIPLQRRVSCEPEGDIDDLLDCVCIEPGSRHDTLNPNTVLRSRSQAALHTFFEMDDGSCLAFFEVPGSLFDFKRQDLAGSAHRPRGRARDLRRRNDPSRSRINPRNHSGPVARDTPQRTVPVRKWAEIQEVSRCPNRLRLGGNGQEATQPGRLRAPASKVP